MEPARASYAALFLYFAALRTAYRHAPVALVYPLARSAPLLIALFGEREHATQRLIWATVLAASLLLIAAQI